MCWDCCIHGSFSMRSRSYSSSTSEGKMEIGDGLCRNREWASSRMYQNFPGYRKSLRLGWCHQNNSGRIRLRPRMKLWGICGNVLLPVVSEEPAMGRAPKPGFGGMTRLGPQGIIVNVVLDGMVTIFGGSERTGKMVKEFEG